MARLHEPQQRAAVHRTAPSVHRGQPGARARGEGHRAAEHLRTDHRHHPGPGLRLSGGEEVSPHRPWLRGDRPACLSLRGHHQRGVHRGDGSQARPDRGRGGRLGSRRPRLPWAIREVDRGCRAADGHRDRRRSGDGGALRGVRQANAPSRRPTRSLPGLLRLSRLPQHAKRLR